MLIPFAWLSPETQSDLLLDAQPALEAQAIEVWEVTAARYCFEDGEIYPAFEETLH